MISTILFIRADTSLTLVQLTQESKLLTSKQWEAGRELSTQIHQVIESLSKESDVSLKDIKGVVVYEGPGSYTGLRISISVANALGYSLDVPIVGSTGEDWVDKGSEKLGTITKFIPVVPVYGGQVFTTQPKK